MTSNSARSFFFTPTEEWTPASSPFDGAAKISATRRTGRFERIAPHSFGEAYHRPLSLAGATPLTVLFRRHRPRRAGSRSVASTLALRDNAKLRGEHSWLRVC